MFSGTAGIRLLLARCLAIFVKVLCIPANVADIHKNGENEFTGRITGIIRENLGNEHFGVKELAARAGLSRTVLNRQLKARYNKTASQYIREIRLQTAMKLLREGNSTASEVAYKVGFGSPAYFSKCFHAYYGHPPGGFKNIGPAEEERAERRGMSNERKWPGKLYFFSIAGIILTAGITFLGFMAFFNKTVPPSCEWLPDTVRSIAVLPFRNLSADPGNSYLAEGITEEIVTRLCQSSDLRVVSRTSVEQFRGTTAAIPEIRARLCVDYIVEGSLQRSGNMITVTVQLIDTREDRHILSEKFDLSVTDIFMLQGSISEQIAIKLSEVIPPKI